MPHIHEYVLVRSFIHNICKPPASLLDVGPQDGKLIKVLKGDQYTLDAIEIFEPYIEKHHLKEKYRNLFVGDVRTYPLNFADYDIILFFDVLEHMTVEEVQILLQRVVDANTHALAILPFCLPQGIVHNNKNEIHVQDDLTAELVKKRYPQLEPLFVDKEHGIYKI